MPEVCGGYRRFQDFFRRRSLRLSAMQELRLLWALLFAVRRAHRRRRDDLRGRHAIRSRRIADGGSIGVELLRQGDE